MGGVSSSCEIIGDGGIAGGYAGSGEGCFSGWV
jgi:hypothetical protein